MPIIPKQLGLYLYEEPLIVLNGKGCLKISQHPSLPNFLELSFYDNTDKGQLFNICYNTINSSKKYINRINPVFADFEKVRFEIKQTLAMDINSPKEGTTNLTEIGRITGIESFEQYKNSRLNHFTLHPFDCDDQSKQRIHLHLEGESVREPKTLSYDRLSGDEDYLLTFVFLNSFITKNADIKGASAIVLGRNIKETLGYKLSTEINFEETQNIALTNSPINHNFNLFTKTNLSDFSECAKSTNINMNTDIFKSIFERANSKNAKGVVILGSPDYALANNDFLYLGYIY